MLNYNAVPRIGCFFLFINRLSKEKKLYRSSEDTYFLMLVHRYFFENCSDFDAYVYIVGKISASRWAHSKNFLNPPEIYLSICRFNTLISYNIRKNRTMSRKLRYVFELHRFASYIKNCYCIIRRSFYKAHNKFQCIIFFCSF